MVNVLYVGNHVYDFTQNYEAHDLIRMKSQDHSARLDFALSFLSGMQMDEY